MDVHPQRRRITPAIPVLAAAALFAIVWSGTVANATVAKKKPLPKHKSTLAGTWTGQYSGAVSGTFTLNWTQTGSTLTGSITLTSPKGKYAIGGHVNGTAISFGAVGAGATYTGSLSGSSMSGKWTSPVGGGSWSANKST